MRWMNGGMDGWRASFFFIWGVKHSGEPDVES